MKMKLFKVIDIDGRERDFYRMEFGNYIYQFGATSEGTLFLCDVYLGDSYTVYYQTLSYETPIPTRRLSDNKVDVTFKTTDKEENSFIIYKFFYILSQLGGLFIFWMLIIGLIIKPYNYNSFRKEVVSFLFIINFNFYKYIVWK